MTSHRVENLSENDDDAASKLSATPVSNGDQQNFHSGDKVSNNNAGTDDRHYNGSMSELKTNSSPSSEDAGPANPAFLPAALLNKENVAVLACVDPSLTLKQHKSLLSSQRKDDDKPAR